MATFTVTPSSIQHTKGGETTNVRFGGSVPQGLDYSISAAFENWVTVTLDGDNTTITSNQNTGVGRTATVTFYDPNDSGNYVDVTITQESGAHPSFSVTPGRYYAGKKGGSIPISFSGDIPDNITHTIYYNIVNNSKVSSGDLANPQNELDWFSLQNNIITIQEWSNTSGTYYNREGYIRFQDSLDPENYVDLWIHQCYNFQLEPVQIYAPISGGSYYVNMMLTSALSNYSYSTLPQWITISPVANPITAREEILVTVSVNSSTKRTGSITITDADGEDVTFKVSQTGSDTSSYPSFSFVPSSYTFKCCASRYTFIREGLGYANNGGYIPYNINVSCPSWMNVVYSDHMEVIVDVEDNTGSQRTGSLILTDADNSSNVYTITVTQEAAGSRVMNVNPYSSFNWHIIDPVYAYYTVATYNTTVSISKSANWINCSEISTSTPDSTYTLGPNKKIYQIIPSYNSGSTSRTGYVYFTDSDNNRSDIEVYQAGPFTANPSSISFPYTSSSTNVILSNGEDVSGVRVNSSDFPGWLHSTAYSYGTNSYTISADKNKYHKTRNFDVDFYDGTVNSYYRKTTVPVTQASNSQEFTVSPSSIAFTVDASTVTVIANHYDNSVSANYSELPDWLNCTKASSTNELVRFNVSALSNRSQTSRSFTINFTDFLDGEVYYVKSVLVNQSGRDTPVLRCTPSSMSFVSSGGSDTVGVNYYGSLSYDSLPDWLSLTATSSTPGVKNYYTVTAAANTGVSRSHSITFTDSEGSVAFPISQEAGSPGPVPVLSVVPSSLSFVSGGGSESLAVTYNGSLSYNSGEVPGWLSVLSTSVSTGYNTYSVTAASNTGEARTFGLVFTDDDTSVSVPISQDGGSGPAPVPISVSPSSLSFTESGGSSTVTVTSSGSVSYNALPGWITMTNSGGVYTVTAAANTGAARTHTIIFTDETGSASVVVSQDAGSTVISVSPSSLSFTRSGGYSYVTVTSSGTVSYSALPDWITITNDGSVYTVTAAANTGSSRNHTITFTDETGSATLVVSQASEYIGDRYTPIWKNTTYYARPEDFPDDLAYKITVSDGSPFWIAYEGYIPFLGVSATNRYINISRLVEDQFPNLTDFTHVITWGPWWISTIIVKIYQKGDPDVLLETYYFIRDWSYYMQGYYTTKTLNDPINGHGCSNMTIPFFVFTMGDTSFSLVETSNSGSQSTRPLNTPISPVCGGLNSFYGDKKVELKGNNNTFVSYDLTYCGSGNLVYRNRFGGYDAFLIEGNIEKKEDYTRDKYNLATVGGLNIDRGLGGDQTLDVHIKTSYTAHTGWLSDDQAERLVFHLLSSPDIYFQSFEGYRYGERHADFNLSKVIITDSSAVYKKFKNGKRMVSYAITFELSDTKKIVY